MTAQELAEIKARAEAATPGVWKVNTDIRDPHVTMGVENSYIDSPKIRLAYVWDTDTQYGKANAAFIANAHQDIPALAAEIERLRSGLSTIESRWREASQDSSFRTHYRQTMELCADELRDLLGGFDDNESRNEGQ